MTICSQTNAVVTSRHPITFTVTDETGGAVDGGSHSGHHQFGPSTRYCPSACWTCRLSLCLGLTKAFKTNLAVQSHWDWTGTGQKRIIYRYFFDAIHLAYLYRLHICLWCHTFGFWNLQGWIYARFVVQKSAPMPYSKLPCCIPPRLRHVHYNLQANDSSMAKVDQWEWNFTILYHESASW